MKTPALFIVLLTTCVTITAQSALEIVRKADEKLKGSSTVASMTIQTVRPNWTREMTLKSWTKGSDYAMILVTAPAKDKGIVYLKRKKEVWNWIPAIERTVKLPPSMMSQSWMGTDFSNDDLVREASITSDYTHTLLGEATVEGRNCFQIRLDPKPEAAVVWGKVVVWIDKKDYLMLRVQYFDEEDELVNTLQNSDIKMLGGKLLPARMEMTPAGKKGHKTVMIYHSMVFDKPISDDFFTSQNMPRVQ